MKNVVVVTEYNPFHTGHGHQIDILKENGAQTVTAVMNGDFVQRSIPAILPKHIRAEQAVINGVDLVIELPFVFGTSSASIFARGAVDIIKDAGVFDTLAFGSENGNRDELVKTAYKINELEEKGIIAEKVKAGLNYPKALSSALKERRSFVPVLPNDVLGVEYIKQMIKTGCDLDIFTHKRTTDYLSETPSGDHASGESIRNLLNHKGDISKYVCDHETFMDMYDRYGFRDMKRFEDLLSFGVRRSIETEGNAFDINPDLFNRICKYSYCNDLTKMIEKIKTARYTYSSVKRALFDIAFGLNNNIDLKPGYIRVLAFNEKGRSLLRKMKKTSSLEIYHTLPKRLSDDYIVKKEFFATQLYGFLTDHSYDDYKLNSCKIDIEKGTEHEADLQRD